jgi:hypothetical protein
MNEKCCKFSLKTSNDEKNRILVLIPRDYNIFISSKELHVKIEK